MSHETGLCDIFLSWIIRTAYVIRWRFNLAVRRAWARRIYLWPSYSNPAHAELFSPFFL